MVQNYYKMSFKYANVNSNVGEYFAKNHIITCRLYNFWWVKIFSKKRNKFLQGAKFSFIPIPLPDALKCFALCCLNMQKSI